MNFASKNFVRVNRTTISILLFLCMFGIIHQIKPALLYTPEGGFRTFGVGYKQKTVVPIWVVSILLAISSYLAVLYYLVFL